MKPDLENKKRPTRGKRRIALWLGILLCLGLAGGEIALRAIHGHGRWHALARSIYHKVNSDRLDKIYSAEAPIERPDEPLSIYNSGLTKGWDDWSWASRDAASTLGAATGKTTLRMTPAGNKGVYLHHATLGTAGYGSLQVYTLGRPQLKAMLVDASGKFGSPVILTNYLHAAPEAGPGWNAARIPLADLGASGRGNYITGVVFQAAGPAQPDTALDRIELLPDPSLPAAPTTATVSMSVDLAGGTHPISPYIYGMAFAPPDYLTDLRITVNRWGGNDKTRYNWTKDASNAARDWMWANKPGGKPDGAPGPSASADDFVRKNRAAGVESLLTVPTMGWVARDANNGTRSLQVPNQGGDPISGPNGPIAGYDPAENRRRTSVPSASHRKAGAGSSGTVYQDEWISHLTQTFGTAARGGVRYYAMDNEPDIWDSTHTDVHPARMGYDDMLANFLDYATAVKAVDPTALITGPVISGWTGYFYSSLDRGNDSFQTHADQARHGGEPFLPWFLKQLHAHDKAAGKRTLDVLDVHYYPQGQGLYTGATDPDAQARRLRATRSLWDPTYTDESWIGKPVCLIPMLKRWVADNYPGTKIGLTEWNFGADQTINGAVAIADVLGIFGREGLDLANYWAYPPQGSPGYLAFKLYRNPDGKGHGFGDLSLDAKSADENRVACFAARDSRTGEVTLMLVNKMPKATVTSPILLKGLAGSIGPITSWTLSAAAPDKIRPGVVLSRTHNYTLTVILPPASATLIRLAGSYARQEAASP